MAFRSTWKGYLKLSLVSVPVRAFAAVSSQEGEVHFHQLHEKCHSRIKYVKSCPVHGPVPQDEIVSGYEYAKEQYVIINEDELAALKGEKEKSINLEAVVPSGAVDALYMTERSSYLLPDGRVGEKPYAVIQQSLSDQGAVAIGRFMTNGKDEVVMIRPLDGLLVMTVLSSAAQVKEPVIFAAELPKVTASPAELKLTKTLLDAYRQDEIDLSKFKEQYTERVAALVEAKIKGKEVVHPTRTEQPDIINLMDALKQSVASAKSHTSKKTADRRGKIQTGLSAPKRVGKQKSAKTA